ncbi:thaumatin-like protein 1 isoform X2 [Cucurbita maxima]|uniref:Thaumatin-like protein 1 isoform X2 n=1 Tax=Cucurbita maxima TaxID=3661 RepID=A0A6J1KNY0_CUCMA|nr:thaumatin-like protein 1 isoform X2 [Cucurbita maxima]
MVKQSISMELVCHFRHSCLFLSSLVLLLLFKEVSCATFMFVNKCDFTVWPGILASAGSPKLETTGFELKEGNSRSLEAPTGWSGRFWGRTGCDFDGSGRGSCSTGDCDSGEMECNGAGATPPATLAEFTLGSGSQDFYDVSLVDGYNLPMIVEGTGGSGTCATTGCITNVNQLCPVELKAEGGGACKSACEAFATPEYCCSGAYNSPATCRPSIYSLMFKSACPRSYSYAYDDATSTFTCRGADYTITFCPSTPRDSPPMVPEPTTEQSGSEPVTGSGLESGSDSIEGATLSNSWLADMTIGNSSIATKSSLTFQSLAILISVLLLVLSG